MAHALPPADLVAALPSDTGAVHAAVETAGEHVFTEPDGRFWRAPLWLVLTDRHAWLAATADGRHWATATGDPAQVHLASGWTRDTLRVGPYTVPLRRGTRKAVQAWIAAWATTGGGGADTPTPTPEPATHGSVAPGAIGLPPWWVDAVPADPDACWLAAAATGETWPFPGRDGHVTFERLSLGVSDRHAALAARAPDGACAVVPVAAVTRVGGVTAATYTAPERTFAGPTLSDAALADVAALTAVPPERRIAAAARLALEAGDGERALNLWAEAARRDQHAPCWADAAAAAWVLDRPERAAAMLVGHLAEPGDLDAFVASLPVAARAVRTVTDATFRTLAQPLLDRMPTLTPVDGLPWPPQAPAEAWAAAAIAVGRPEDALAVSARMTAGPRRLAVGAAARTAAGDPTAPDAWDRAAAALREAGDPDAPAALDRAIALHDSGARRWRRAAWAFADGDAATAEAAWRAALDSGWDAPSGLDAAGERALVEVATRHRSWAAAAAAAERAVTLDPDGHVDDRPRYVVFHELARLRARAGRDDALAALRQGLAADFLRPEAWTAALDCPGVDPGPPLRAWWEHLLGVLDPRDPIGAPRPPAASLTDADLDALHPGGAGWLDALRGRLPHTDPPTRSALVRGLERVEPDTWPDVWDALTSASTALGLPEPPATWLYRGDGAWGASAWPLDPPVLLLGHEHVVDGPRRLDPAALRFLLAVELTHLRCHHPLLAFDATLVGTSRSVYEAFGRYAGPAETVVDVVTLLPGVDQLAKLQTIVKLSKRVLTAHGAVGKVAKAGDQLTSWLRGAPDDARAPTREGLTGAALQMRIQADRAALLVTGDAAAAVDAILRGSSRSLAAADRVRSEGLAAVLAGALPVDESLRLTALMSFAAGLS